MHAIALFVVASVAATAYAQYYAPAPATVASGTAGSTTTAATATQGNSNVTNAGHCVVDACGRGLTRGRGYTNIPASNFDVLYTCVDGTNVKKVAFCINGCNNNPLGIPDNCNTPTCNPNNTGCGSTLVEEKGFAIGAGQLDSLFTCAADGFSLGALNGNCANGCQNQGAGVPDACRNAALPQNVCNAGNNGCGRTYVEERGYKLDLSQLDSLLLCGSDGKTLTKVKDCAVGCRNGGLGKPDFCRQETPSCPAGLVSCGRTLVQERGYAFSDAQLDTLFICGADNATETVQQACANGCINKGAGVPDSCK